MGPPKLSDKSPPMTFEAPKESSPTRSTLSRDRRGFLSKRRPFRSSTRPALSSRTSGHWDSGTHWSRRYFDPPSKKIGRRSAIDEEKSTTRPSQPNSIINNLLLLSGDQPLLASTVPGVKCAGASATAAEASPFDQRQAFVLGEHLSYADRTSTGKADNFSTIAIACPGFRNARCLTNRSPRR